MRSVDTELQIDMTASKEDKLAQITEQLHAKYGGLAEIMGQTAVGRLTQLKNAWVDVQEEVGRFLLAGAKPLVEAFTSISEGIKSFMQDSEKMRGLSEIISDLAAGFAVLIEMGKQLGGTGKDFLGKVFDSLGEALTKVVGKGNESSAVFKVLGGLLQIISAGFAISAAYINFWIQSIADLVVAIIKTVDLFKAFGYAVTHLTEPGVWDKVGAAGGATLDAFANFGKGMIGNVKNIADVVTTEINGFFSETEKRAKTLQDTFDKTKKTVQNGISSPTMGSPNRGPQQWSDTGAQADFSQIGKYQGMGGYAGSEGMGDSLGNLFAKITPILDQFSGGLLNAFMGIENVVAVMDPLTTIVKGFADIISGPVNKALQPIINILLALGKGIGQVLLPVIEFFGKIILGIASFIAMIFNGIASVINFLLGWAGVHIDMIDIGNLSAAPASSSASDKSSGDSGTVAGGTAQYTAAPVINMNINIYATAITAGDKIMTLEDLAILLNEKLNAAMELR